MKLEHYLAIFAIIILGMLIYNQFLITNLLYPSAINYGKNKFEQKTNNEVTGLYVPNCGYFVDTRGRNIQAINTTEYHEACHALIKQDTGGHYCENN